MCFKAQGCEGCGLGCRVQRAVVERVVVESGCFQV